MEEHTTSKKQDNLSISIDPSQLNVSLEQTQAPSTPQAKRSSGMSSPVRGRCVKEYEEQLQQLQHENFNLKLRVFLLEERVGKAMGGRADAADVIKNNIELKIESETLKKSLTEKNELLSQAKTAIDELERQQRASLSAHQNAILALQHQIDKLEKDLADSEEARIISQQRMPDESTDLYAQAFGSFVLNSQPQSLNCNHHRCQEELQLAMDQVARLTREVGDYQNQVGDYQQKIKQLENDLSDQQKRTIQSVENDPSGQKTIKDEVVVSTKEAVEKDKIIEEKQYQLEQQNKILVEIQITLDEKQKQIEELESALSERRKKVEDLEKSLTKAGRTIQGFVADVQKKEKELEIARVDSRKKDKKIRDLTAELKEAQEMLNKAKWEAETSGREDNVKAMAEEENERLWAELEEKKRLLSAAERQKALLQQDSDQLASLRLAVGRKEQAVVEAELRITTLQRQVADLQQELAGRRIPSSVHSPTELGNQMAAFVRERQELTETIRNLKEQLTTRPADDLKEQYEASQAKSIELEKELERLRVELRSWKKRAEGAVTEASSGGDNLRMFKKEVTVLRQRLADSTNACDILRTRLEEMADFLEEIISMSQSELHISLSNWSASRRQALQHSIMQSRELSRSLSQSLMIGVDQSALHSMHDDDSFLPKAIAAAASRSSSSVGSSSSWSSSREKSLDRWSDRNASLPPPSIHDDLLMESAVVQTAANTSPMQQQQAVVDQLRVIVAQLEEQVKQRDVEIAWMNMEREKYLATAATATAAANNKSIQQQQAEKKTANSALVSSTPYPAAPGGQGQAVSFLSPVAIGRSTAVQQQQRPDNKESTTTSPKNSTITPPARPSTVVAPVPGASESEAWSEPDRSVSFARIGLPAAHLQEINSIAALVQTNAKKGRSHSNAASSSDSSNSSSNSRRTARRTRSDPCEVKRSSQRIRSLEKDNSNLRLQLAQVLESLRSTYESQLQGGKDDHSLMDDSQQQTTKDESSLAEERRRSIEDVDGDVALTARFVVEALQGRLLKMKELLRRREQRMRESNDVITQLEFKVKEQYFQGCEVQLLLKETQQQLADKNQEVERLDARWIEAQSQWTATSSAKERQMTELRVELDKVQMEVRGAHMKAQLWENSYNESQKSLRLIEADLKEQNAVLESQICQLKEEHNAIKSERSQLAVQFEALKKSMEESATKLQESRRSSNTKLQRQSSQMSDYVSDQAVSAEEQVLAVLPAVADPNRPSTLHFSPDLGIGIDSDQGRFSSLEHSAVEQQKKQTAATLNQHWSADKSGCQKEVKTDLTLLRLKREPLSVSPPDVLQPGTTTDCVNCPRWQNKYHKAKQTLAVALEKLQAANVRKEKVDRALSKELGKTHNILCQARGILEQANQSSQKENQS